MFVCVWARVCVCVCLRLFEVCVCVLGSVLQIEEKSYIRNVLNFTRSCIPNWKGTPSTGSDGGVYLRPYASLGGE